MKRIALIAAVVILSASSAEAGWPMRASRQCQGSSCSTYAAPVQYVRVARPQAMTQAAMTQATVQTASYTAATTTADAGDAYGFTAWINGVRARYGLRALVWSADAAAHAAINSARGFGHSYMGGTRRQNVGMGSLGQVEQGWLTSPGHFEAIVDPYVSEVGLAYVNGVWTMNAR